MWPRELKPLQIEKKTCKLRKQLPQFDNTHAANAHTTTKKRNALQIKCIWLCCEHLQCVSLFVLVVSMYLLFYLFSHLADVFIQSDLQMRTL